MYIAALRIADDFGCDAIGIQYQQGLKDICPASDLVEGLLNNVDRPPVAARDGGRVLYEGEALPHFNEVDECAGLDALVTNRVWTQAGLSARDHAARRALGRGVRSGRRSCGCSRSPGAVPPAHLIGGYAGAVSERQPPMYFPLGGGTIKGVCKPGEVVWSRVFVDDGKTAGRHRASPRRSNCREEETERRWQATTPQWPIMHAVLHGVDRDQMMARHKSNHIQVAYVPQKKDIPFALGAQTACFPESRHGSISMRRGRRALI